MPSGQPNNPTGSVGDNVTEPAVIGVVVAGVRASLVAPGPYSWGSTLVGIVLAMVLSAYVDWPLKLARPAIGFAAAWAFVVLLIVGLPLDQITGASFSD
jgi:hypothetical protein